ncbi:hypothetical protein L6452_22842 [Arctium lappa]|uniref:Uncharacterized protein n=1 Tax=Arctium lappa TaxID=4217 RepID=A0ACB9B1V4_ARCLA|nr:hypothetical protein L6452_22842 [Arctium lappa]
MINTGNRKLVLRAASYTDGTFGGSELHPSSPLELSEQPMLKLLPRTKSINLETVVAYKQTIPPSSESSLVDI